MPASRASGSNVVRDDRGSPVLRPMDTPVEDKRQRGAWPTIFSILLAGALLYLSVRGVNWGAVWATAAGAHWVYLAAVALLMAVSYFVRAVRWRILLNAEARLGVGTVFCANMTGYLGNNFLPARAGELIRSY